MTYSRHKWAAVFCVCLHFPPSSLMFQLGVCCLWALWPANSSEGPCPHDIRDSAWFLGRLKGFPAFLPAVAIWAHTCPHPLPRAGLLLVAPLTGVMGQEAGTPRGGRTGCLTLGCLVCVPLSSEGAGGGGSRGRSWGLTLGGMAGQVGPLG